MWKWALSFIYMTYVFYEMTSVDTDDDLPWIKCFAGVLTLIFTNPLWVVKTRLCLQYSDFSEGAPAKHYRGMMDAFLKVYRFEGIIGLYKVLLIWFIIHVLLKQINRYSRFTGFFTWSIWCFSWCFTIHGLWRAEETLLQLLQPTIILAAGRFLS